LNIIAYTEKNLTGWGHFPTSVSKILRPERSYEIDQLVECLKDSNIIARGSGLAYGDAAINNNEFVLLTEYVNNILSFDPINGTITCQGGVKLEDILSVTIPKGWFLPVTPGTARATVGGCMACDVHGKNHHTSFGSFANNVLSVGMLTGTGEHIECSPYHNSDIFWATAGGIGLTGIILEITIQLIHIETTQVLTKHICTESLEETLSVLTGNNHYAYSVAWVDSTSRGKNLGKGVVMLGEHESMSKEDTSDNNDEIYWTKFNRAHLPVRFPEIFLNKYSSLLFNNYVYWSSKRRNYREVSVNLSKYFYQLDRVDNWYKLYGKKGFIEYQIVVPENNAFEIFRTILEKLKEGHFVSLLTSIKRMGKSNNGFISFPMEGYALSIDVPKRNNAILALLNHFDKLVIGAGGRVYLAKDSRLNKESFLAMYPRVTEWIEIIDSVNPNRLFSSDMSRRLGI
tara:strand:+ start:3693 stop:5063 length:1371 start_codon:yes stop_codon:yes gene_type:complete